MKWRRIVLGTAASLALVPAPGAEHRKLDDSNTCGATVLSSDVRQDADGRHWHFVWNIVAGNGSDSAESDGTFLYRFTYIDSTNTPQPTNGVQSQGWHANDGHSFSKVDTQDIPDAVSIDASTVSTYDITSRNCHVRARFKS
jgi:hypothetical protein